MRAIGRFGASFPMYPANALINSSGAHPPPGNYGAFAQMSVPGVGH